MMWLWLGGGLTLVFIAYVALSMLFAHLFTSLKSTPGVRDIRTTPAEADLPYEEVAFAADGDGLRIAGWLISRPASTTAVVVVPPGGGNRLHMPGSLKIAHALWERGHTLLLCDPRGTGHSEGDRASYGFLEARDLIGALRFLAQQGFPPHCVGVVGWSMGGATAMFALEKIRYGGLVVDSPLAAFTLDDISRYVSRSLGLPVPLAKLGAALMMPGVFTGARLLLGMNLRAHATDVLHQHPVPTVVIHGTADTQVSVSAGRAAARAAGDKLIDAYFLDGVEHAQAFAANPEWWLTTVGDALEQMLR